MQTQESINKNQVVDEINKIPTEYLPSVLKMLQAFREGVTIASPDESFRQGWEEMLNRQTSPVSELWEEIDAK